MNRRELLKQTCGLGLCACAGIALLEGCDSTEDTNTTDASAQELRRLQWWLEHCKRQNTRLWELLGDYLDEASQIAVLEQPGASFHGCKRCPAFWIYDIRTFKRLRH